MEEVAVGVVSLVTGGGATAGTRLSVVGVDTREFRLSLLADLPDWLLLLAVMYKIFLWNNVYTGCDWRYGAITREWR